MNLDFISFYTGVGGFDLGFEKAGFKCECQVEKEEYFLRVLEHHWPHTRKVRLIEEFPVHEKFKSKIGIGGFPCQGVSNSGKRKGLADERSGLWRYYIKTVCDLGLEYFVVENVGALTKRGLGEVLGDIHSCGFDAEWGVIPASALGYPHRRERVFIFAYPSGHGLEGGLFTASPGQEPVEALDYSHDRLFISEPFGIRTTDGFPHYVEQITGLGNAVAVGVGKFVGTRAMWFFEKNGLL